MAYVAITQSLRSDVKCKILNMQNAELGVMADPGKVLNALAADPVVHARALELLWEPVKDLRERLEQYNPELTVRVKLFSEPSDSDVEFDLPKLRVPCIYHPVYSYYHSDPIVLKVSLDFDPRIAEYITLLGQRGEAEQRWDKVAKQVDDFLRNCKSLNEGVKLWPDVKRYLPAEAIKKMGQKSAKAERDATAVLDALRAIDMDAVNASTVLARMAGATV